MNERQGSPLSEDWEPIRGREQEVEAGCTCKLTTWFYDDSDDVVGYGIMSDPNCPVHKDDPPAISVTVDVT